jgi:hypothetical protein
MGYGVFGPLRVKLRNSMHNLLAATLFFGILTLWVPGYWAVAVFEVSMFGLAVGAILRWRRTSPPFAYPLVPLLFAVFWGLLQLWTGRTVSPFETRIALGRWATLLAVFIVGLVLFQDMRVHRWFRSAMVWFGFLHGGGKNLLDVPNRKHRACDGTDPLPEPLRRLH